LSKKNSLVWGRVTDEEKKLIDQLCQIMHCNMSEFIRYVILQELERRSLISTQIEKLKEDILNNQKR
jgi:uncharacterized protein (DUF1778 family)